MTIKELEEEYLRNSKLHGDLNISNKIANRTHVGFGLQEKLFQ